jgi:hypothetical protein
VDDGIAPRTPYEQVMANAAFDDHTEFAHEVIGDGVVRGTSSPDAMQAEVVEPERQ